MACAPNGLCVQSCPDTTNKLCRDAGGSDASVTVGARFCDHRRAVAAAADVLGSGVMKEPLNASGVGGRLNEKKCEKACMEEYGGRRGGRSAGAARGAAAGCRAKLVPVRAEPFHEKTRRDRGPRPHGVELGGTPRRARWEALVDEDSGVGAENNSRSCRTGEARGGGRARRRGGDVLRSDDGRDDAHGPAAAGAEGEDPPDRCSAEDESDGITLTRWTVVDLEPGAVAPADSGDITGRRGNPIES